MYKTGIIDEKIIKNITKGDVFAFKILYHFFYPKVYTFIKKHLHNPEDSEELTQDLFLKIWESRERINTSHPIDGYIFKIAKNSLIDFYRKKKSVNVSIEKINTIPYQEIDPASQLYNKELTNFLNHVIETLPPKRKEIYLLSREEGLTYIQIAHQLGISVKTVETQISLALKAIKQKIRYNTDMILVVALILKNFF
ncbi:RNA polymerase sigma factor [Chondrinema litorale]|uniref:RNA polymerase sigma factor n=1 Tax=Chondrinema litorale TaxID=2994555 RepID=UPI002542A56D|nr:RNA polymerase sigma-70 factor [Chondrinema litorale]UZR98969.1 RNA polymerase sigma-70 factor [Chondrinema litorale]